MKLHSCILYITRRDSYILDNQYCEFYVYYTTNNLKFFYCYILLFIFNRYANSLEALQSILIEAIGIKQVSDISHSIAFWSINSRQGTSHTYLHSRHDIQHFCGVKRILYQVKIYEFVNLAMIKNAKEMLVFITHTVYITDFNLKL